MASGHANRANRPNTWLHRPSLRREDSPCQPGAVHTWHLPDEAVSRGKVRSLGMTDMSRTCPYRRIRVSYTCVNRNSYNSICKMYFGELNEVKPLRRREILPELPPDFRGFDPKTGQKAGASSIPAEHDGAGPAGQQRQRGGGKPV